MLVNDVMIVDDDTEPLNGVEVRVIRIGWPYNSPSRFTVAVEETKTKHLDDGAMWMDPRSLKAVTT